MKVSEFKKVLEIETQVTYEKLQERFDPDFSECDNLEELIKNKESAASIIEWAFEWGETEEGHNYWSKIFYSLLKS